MDELSQGEEALHELQETVSEALSDLSKAERAPSGVRNPEPFEPVDVDWGTSSWIARVLDVQGWLRLPVTLDGGSPAGFVSTLQEALDPQAHTPELVPHAERLDLTGTSRLRERCARALELQTQFFENLEEDPAGATAAQRWRDAWDDVDEEQDNPSAEPVSASTDVWPIQSFAGYAGLKKLNLSPSYQRGDVWPTPDAQILIESILRGIPLPSVIILKSATSETSKFEVVDGKQRLTAILRFIGKHPDALDLVADADKKYPEYRLGKLFNADYRKFRLAWKNATGEQLTDKTERANYFPFKLRTGADNALKGPLESFQGRYYTEIRNFPLKVSDSTGDVWEVFESPSSYKIPVIQYTKATARQVHEVFKLYNKQGKQLNAEEIRNAMYHELGLMRGILVAAGDSKEPAVVAPFLHGGQPLRMTQPLEDLGAALTGYQFGVTRYKRTKVLSWLVSLLLLDSRQDDGKLPVRRSTAGQIDFLLRSVEDDAKHPLRSERRLKDLFEVVASVVEAHSEVPDAWSEDMRGGKAGRWQEMPLVGSLLGVAQSVLIHGQTTTIDLLDDRYAALSTPRQPLFKRPDSIQTGSQWDYLARVSVGVARRLDVDPSLAHDRLVERFGSSGIAALSQLAPRTDLEYA